MLGSGFRESGVETGKPSTEAMLVWGLYLFQVWKRVLLNHRRQMFEQLRKVGAKLPRQ